MSTVAVGDAALRDREERLRSAKKKLKSYRAKQAQLGQARRSSKLGSIGSVADSIASTSFDSVDRQSVGLHSVTSVREKRRSRPLSGFSVSHGRSHSRTNSVSVRDSTLLFASLAPVEKSAAPGSKVRVVPQSASHYRGHSRSGSRSLSLSKRDRPSSIIQVKVKEDEERASNSWSDVDESSLHTPTPNTYNESFSDRIEEVTPLARTLNANRPLASNVLSNIPSSSTLTSRILCAPSVAPEPGHARRKSRHSRKDSVSTRRESMEIMGGVHSISVNPALQGSEESNGQTFAQRKSRRISSHRWSGLQAASVLFGGSPELSGTADKRTSGMDWRSAFGTFALQDQVVDSRETALDKLEGRFKGEVQQSSVQLPSFDDVHGATGMNKRASQDLLESNVKTTSSDRSNLVAVPHAATSSKSDSTSHEMATSDSCLGAEGLGTLMEEEEEEEDVTSPIRERGEAGFSTIDSDSRQRKEAENEVVKRTRRTSLQPAPLKLKSRPASLFIAPRPPSSSIAVSGSATRHAADVFEGLNDSGSSTETTTAKNFDEMTPSELHRKIAAARLAGVLPGSETSTPTKSAVSEEMKRAWRASMPSAAASPAATNAPSSSTTPSRSGMRPLRLADTLQHRANAESSSSLASPASTTFPLANVGQSPLTTRASLVLGSTPSKRSSIGYNNSLREEVSTPTKASRRSSIHYRSSNAEGLGLETPEKSASDVNPTVGTHTSGVPMGVFEELKAKHQRDITLLDDLRKTTARLEAELASETERSRREYSELERWSAEEKRTLGQRIEHLEANIVEITEVREARDEHHQRLITAEQDKVKALQTQLEDAESERDMLREDVEGWRARCKDLEGNLKSSQPSLSPMLRAISRDGSVSPILDADVAPPPQAIQLLKDMRQHIMSLARSLELEREEHARTRQMLQSGPSPAIERDTLDHSTYDLSSAVNSFVTDQSSVQHHDDSSLANTTIPSSSSLERIASMKPINHAQSDSQTSIQRSAQRQSPIAAPKRNHVSAYDSSMESGKRSASNASVSTQQTSEYHADGPDSPSHCSVLGSNKATVNALDESEVSNGDAIGLGVDALDTVAEEEEALTEQADVGSTMSSAPVAQRASVDVESAGRRSDLESVAPPTPALEHYSPQHRVKHLSPLSDANRSSEQTVLVFDDSVSTSTSADLAGSVPPSSHASQDTIVTPAMDNDSSSFANNVYDHDDDTYEDEDELPPPPAPRPEFMREWSFERAMFAAQNSPQMRKAKPQLRIGIQPRAPIQQARRRNKMSIDDFFGIMNIDDESTLPALPTPDEALEMPPVQLLSGADPYNPHAPSFARLSNSAIRPPVAKTSRAYGQPMVSRTINSQIGRANAGYPQRTVSQPSVQSAGPRSSGEGYSHAGAGMFSRVVSLTSAFGGYFTGSTSPDSAYNPTGYARNHVDAEAGGPRHDSVSWSVARRVDVEEA